MASQSPSCSAPTSLLWAHQLKREHGFLLQRMQDLEAKNEKQEARISTAEAASNKSNSENEIHELADQVKVLKEAGVEGRLEAMEKDVAEKLEGVQVESQAHTLQITALQEDGKAAEEARKEASAQDRTLLERIGAVEQNLTMYERSLERMGKRLDEDRFQQIRGRLEGLIKQVEHEGEEMKWLSRSISALEDANAELVMANEKLEAEMAKMAAKAANGANGSSTKDKHVSRTNMEDEQQATPGAEDTPSKRKSHKWSGGGADRDIIRLGSGMFGEPRTVQRSPQALSKETPKKRPAPPGPKKRQQQGSPPTPKAQPAISNDSDDTPKKSHRWSGGGADRDIIQSGLSQPSSAKRRQSSDVVTEPPKKKPSRPQPAQQNGVETPKKQLPGPISEVENDEVVVRSGKGWVEVRGPAPSEPPVKRKPGRPRKAHITPDFSLEELSQGRVTRRGVQQKQIQPPKKKRARGSAVGNEAEDYSSEPALKKTTLDAPQPRPAVAAEEPAAAAVDVYTAPVSSPPAGQETVRYGSKGPALERGARPQVPRRQILQFEDEVSEMQ